jgi:hypothetical protein
MDAIFGCDHLLSKGCDQDEGAGDAEIALWYVAACICTAADEALLLSASCAEALPAPVGALAMHLALSKPFLSAVSGLSGHVANHQYVKAAAVSAYKVTKAAASSALAAQPLHQGHLWALGKDNLEKAVCSTGQNARQLLLLAQDHLRMVNSSTGIDTQHQNPND